jgi:hypothetical protein
LRKFSQRFYLYSFFVLVIALVTFGTSFSKFHVAGQIYLHDCILIALVISIILNPPRVLPFIPVTILLLFSLAYFAISLFLMRTSMELIVRQYAIFGYLGCYYLIFTKTLGTPILQFRNFIFLVGCLSVTIQLIYIFYLLINGVSVLDEYNYYSPAIVLGIIICGASVLVFVSSIGLKLVLFFFILVLSTSTGHSSAALSLLILLGAFVLFGVSYRGKLIISACGVIGLLLLYLLMPQFQDNNASFRLIAWNYTIERLIVENGGIIGEGFGIPYFDKTLILDLYDKIGSVGFFGIDQIIEGYLSSVHNSFLTIFLSVGLIPGLLILFPFVRILQYLRRRKYVGTPYADFIFLSLIGICVWVSFNEILELPHSAALFWLVYFCSLSVSIDDVPTEQSASLE